MATMEEIKAKIYSKVEAYAGKKQVKAPNLTKEVCEALGCDKKEVKAALKELMDEGKLTYGYFGGTTIEIPHVEGSAN
jgi:transcription initiation factor TFIIIB Brf1 subunit/transcription initiation factor TFIIB